jgi:hypothetical protein
MDKRLRLTLLAILVTALFFMLRQGDIPKPDQRAVVAQVRQLNQLATVRYTVQKVVSLQEQKQPVGAESILLVLQARVEAGIDLSTLRDQDVTNGSNGSLVVRMPPAQIMSVAVDEKETRVWDRQKTWWTPWIPYSLDLEQRARAQGLEAVKKAALEMGILKDAERNAETSIRGLLGLAGVKQIVIVPAGVS